MSRARTKTLQFAPATKQQSWLRLAIYGPSGSGKTMSALRIATGLGGKIAVVDTEYGSARLYSDRWDFDVIELDQDQRSIEVVLEVLQIAAENKYPVLVLDSLSHFWKHLLEEVDKIAHAKFRGNTWAAWSEGTPKQNRLIDAILRYPGHIIATMRTRTEWLPGESKSGKGHPVRVGLAPEQGKGVEYEFTVLMEISTENVAHVVKDRTGSLQGQLIEKPDEKLGEQLRDWLAEGEPMPEPPAAPITPVQVRQISEAVKLAGLSSKEENWGLILWAAEADPSTESIRDFTEEQGNLVLRALGSIGPDGSHTPNAQRIANAINAWAVDAAGGLPEGEGGSTPPPATPAPPPPAPPAPAQAKAEPNAPAEPTPVPAPAQTEAEPSAPAEPVPAPAALAKPAVKPAAKPAAPAKAAPAKAPPAKPAASEAETEDNPAQLEVEDVLPENTPAEVAKPGEVQKALDEDLPDIRDEEFYTDRPIAAPEPFSNAIDEEFPEVEDLFS